MTTTRQPVLMASELDACKNKYSDKSLLFVSYGAEPLLTCYTICLRGVVALFPKLFFSQLIFSDSKIFNSSNVLNTKYGFPLQRGKSSSDLIVSQLIECLK